MAKLKMYQIICGFFPPIVSQFMRSKIFPIKEARQLKLNFSKTSITGSIFTGNTSDDHSYRFAIHGFFDWRNIIIANVITRKYEGDIIEVGANVGTETISYCDLVSPKWKVHAFEPLPENIQSLKRLSQSVKNLKVYKLAISNKIASMRFQIPPAHESGIGKIIIPHNDWEQLNTIEVKTLPLDSYLNILKKVSLISIDTEGHEPFVLEGAKEVLAKFRPTVIIEINSKLLKKYAASSPDKVLQFFTDRDYLCLAINRLTMSALFGGALHLTKSQNWLCIPKEKQRIINSVKRDLFIRAIVPWYLLKSIKNEMTIQ